jgi:hypothetical protein
LSTGEVDTAAQELEKKLVSTQSKLSKVYGEDIANDFVRAIREKVDGRISLARSRITKKENSSVLHDLASAPTTYAPKFTITKPRRSRHRVSEAPASKAPHKD